MRKHLILFVLFLFVLSISSIIATAQHNFKPGLVVGNSGDTLKGQINYLNWQTNPRKITFQPDQPGKPPIQYDLSDLQYFEITGEDSYKRAVVVRDMRPVRIEEITNQTKDSTSTDTVFLRVLVKGGG